jgi:hypothetical protein
VEEIVELLGFFCFLMQQIGDECNVDADCSSGLYCSLCAAAGDVSTTCIRSQATPVPSFPKV